MNEDLVFYVASSRDGRNEIGNPRYLTYNDVRFKTKPEAELYALEKSSELENPWYVETHGFVKEVFLKNEVLMLLAVDTPSPDAMLRKKLADLRSAQNNVKNLQKELEALGVVP